MLHAEYNVEHQELANPDTNHIFPEYIQKGFESCATYLAKHMKGMTLISFSMPTNLTSLCNRGAVPVLGIFHVTLHGHCSALVFLNIWSHSHMGRFEIRP
jgi:hypothetical protein